MNHGFVLSVTSALATECKKVEVGRRLAPVRALVGERVRRVELLFDLLELGFELGFGVVVIVGVLHPFFTPLGVRLRMETKENDPTLHIYPQEFFHGEAWIAGTKEGLTALRDALTRAIDTNEPAATTAFPTDGEGYRVFVLPLSKDRMDELRLAYYDVENLWKGKHPYEMVDTDAYIAIMRGEKE